MQPATVSALPAGSGGPPTAAAPRDSTGSTNGSAAENAPPKLGYVVPAPSFSYSVLANTSAASPAPNISSTLPQNVNNSKPETLPGPPPQSVGSSIPLHSNMGTAPLWPTGPQPFAAPHGMLGPSRQLGPPGLSQPAPVPSSNTTLPPVASGSSSSLRPNVEGGTVSSTPAVQQQVYSPYPSLPPIAANPQGLWLQPPQMSGMARPSFMQYPAVFPAPFPFPAHGIPPQSISFPDPRPPGVIPVGPTSGVPPSSVPSSQFVGNSNLPAQINPAPVDSMKQATDKRVNDGVPPAHVDAWTAHRAESGTVYYYNALTGESTYERPAGFNGQPDAVALQPTPVSMEKVAGTDWEIVTMNDGRKYYYNNNTKLSSWHIPPEISEVRKQQDSVLVKDTPTAMPNASIPDEKGSGSINLSAPALNTGGRDATALRPSVLAPPPSSALDLVKKKLQEFGAPGNSSPVPVLSGAAVLDSNGVRSNDASGKVQSDSNKEKLKDANDDDNLSDTSSDSEDADGGPTTEEFVRQFKEMLKERGVAPFSKWEKELPKLVFDPRFKAIPSYSTRRSLFEHYVKTRAEEERREKRAAQKAAIEGFKQLLDEASEDIAAATDYYTFRKKWGNDSRFEALDRKDRESLLNERVLPLKKAAEENARALRAAVASSFKSLLREKGDVTVNSRWSRVKDNLRDDPRYRTVSHEDREVIFNEYIAELKAAQDKEEQEAKAKRDEQDKLKERERDLRKRKEREEQEMERVRLKIRRKEAVSSFQALLVEMIKDPQASWVEAKAKLEKDPQGRAMNPELDSSDKEKLFREHIKMLYERCAHEFKALLSESVTAEAASQETEDGKTILNSWSTAKHLLRSDPRYNKMPHKDREALWRRHVDDLLRKQKSGDDSKRDERVSDPKGRGLSDSGKSHSDSRRTRDRG